MAQQLNKDDYVFFWKTNEVHGWGSQWYHSPFTAKVVFEEGDKEEEVKFATAEHWMMVQKALLFKDAEVAREVLEVEGTGQKDMTYVKSLGRKVRNFDEEKWVEARERIVLEGNLLKFSQNQELGEKLVATGDKQIVEASPRDRIWGVGFGEKNALEERTRWGLNLLGKALESTRGRLRNERGNS
ncbi:hypothetical protein CPB84DRAFT_1851336 [Gymnopilus junonius]|uniref:NADAR domain-containing protein n=1 Tax=Gymnopilus junonius TaxID=109634 RepID=A0A9P5NFE1_GYMJU|nr:hypothetical protein CPB84DRAFT_1851336 [Gymnopilus junonius]